MFFPVVMPSNLDWKYIEDMNQQQRKNEIRQLAMKYAIGLIHNGEQPDRANKKAFELAEQFFEFSDSFGEEK